MVRIASLAALVVGVALACGGRREGPGAPVGLNDPTATAKGAAKASATAPPPAGTPLEFILDPVERDPDFPPASDALRGKRAIVLVVATYDGSSLVQLRTLAPMLNALPADTQCLLVALQPLGDRPLIAAFFDAEPTPCIRAIGDVSRQRLGDLANVKVIPTTIVLRRDGTMVGAAEGVTTVAAVREELEQAR